MRDKHNTLQHRLSVLAQSGGDGFDPARWSYITSLARRAQGKQDAVKRQIEQIALKALDDYQNCFDQERAKAAGMMANVVSDYPDATEPVRTLFAKGDFRGLRRQLARLSQRYRPGVLTPLTNRLMSGAHVLEKKKMPPTVEDLLRQQDAEVLQSVGSVMAQDGDLPENTEKSGLNPFHLFRKTWSKLYSDRLVARAMKERPENAGPLNSQMLATRTLFIMRNLSPSYLNWFVSYVDTLLWLEQTGEEITPRADKKRNRYK
jgi:hypothetical protein